MERESTVRKLELVGKGENSTTPLDPEIKRACRSIGLWALKKTDLTFEQRDYKLDYIAHELELDLPVFRQGFMALIKRDIIEPSKSNERLKHHDKYRLRPDKLAADPELASRSIIKAITMLGNGNHDPVETSAA